MFRRTFFLTATASLESANEDASTLLPAQTTASSEHADSDGTVAWINSLLPTDTTAMADKELWITMREVVNAVLCDNKDICPEPHCTAENFSTRQLVRSHLSERFYDHVRYELLRRTSEFTSRFANPDSELSRTKSGLIGKRKNFPIEELITATLCANKNSLACPIGFMRKDRKLTLACLNKSCQRRVMFLLMNSKHARQTASAYIPSSVSDSFDPLRTIFRAEREYDGFVNACDGKQDCSGIRNPPTTPEPFVPTKAPDAPQKPLNSATVARRTLDFESSDTEIELSDSEEEEVPRHRVLERASRIAPCDRHSRGLRTSTLRPSGAFRTFEDKQEDGSQSCSAPVDSDFHVTSSSLPKEPLLVVNPPSSLSGDKSKPAKKRRVSPVSHNSIHPLGSNEPEEPTQSTTELRVAPTSSRKRQREELDSNYLVVSQRGPGVFFISTMTTSVTVHKNSLMVFVEKSSDKPSLSVVVISFRSPENKDTQEVYLLRIFSDVSRHNCLMFKKRLEDAIFESDRKANLVVS